VVLLDPELIGTGGRTTALEHAVKVTPAFFRAQRRVFPMKRSQMLFGVAFCLQSVLVAPATALTQDEIAGTWTVVSIVHEEQSGKKNTPLGEHPKGVLVIGRDNRCPASALARQI